MYIGEVSRITGLSIKAIRLYEQMQLIPTPARQGRYRVYNQQHLQLLKLIQDAKRIGMTLNQLKQLQWLEGDAINWPRISRELHHYRAQLVAKQQQISEQLTQLDACYQQLLQHESPFCPADTLDSAP